ncbi:hypothetical protein [Lysobacter gummosus]|uniref:hypothetical protein n=1 Tax=Lysobacter gummosus TaxID=262324 RepID=UPI00362E9650
MRATAASASAALVQAARARTRASKGALRGGMRADPDGRRHAHRSTEGSDAPRQSTTRPCQRHESRRRPPWRCGANCGLMERRSGSGDGKEAGPCDACDICCICC